MLKYGKHLDGGEHCVFKRTVEARGKGLGAFANQLGKIVKKELYQETSYDKVNQTGWIEKENHRTVLVGFGTGAFTLLKKARVTLT